MDEWNRSNQVPESKQPADESGDSFSRTVGGSDAASTSAGGDETQLSTRDEWQRSLDEQREKYLRLAAEYENFRKRALRERQEAGWRAQGELVSALLDPLDDLMRFAHVDPETVDAKTVVEGAALVEKKLFKALAGQGVEMINPNDSPFDPALHEAVSSEAALSPEDDHLVARVYQPGYLFRGQLLRPARVAVKQWNG